MRFLIAFLMFAGIIVIGVAWLRSMVNAPPPDPEATDVLDRNLKYVCTYCGLELRVEKASQEKAPSHCGEKMILLQGA